MFIFHIKILSEKRIMCIKFKRMSIFTNKISISWIYIIYFIISLRCFNLNTLLLTILKMQFNINLYGFNVDWVNVNYYLQWIFNLMGVFNKFPSYNNLVVRYPNCNNMNFCDFLNTFATYPTIPKYTYTIIPTLDPAEFNYNRKLISL